MLLFHGTSGDRLDAILREGLRIAASKNWPGFEDGHFSKPANGSLPGIYLASSTIKARGATWQGNHRRGRGIKSAILGVEADPARLLPDEDMITYTFANIVIPGLISTDYNVPELWLIHNHSVYSEMRTFASTCRQAYIDSVVRNLSSGRYPSGEDIEATRTAASAMFELALNRAASHCGFDRWSWKSLVQRALNVSYDDTEHFRLPDPVESEKAYSAGIDRAAHLCAWVTDPAKDSFTSLPPSYRCLSDIGFEGFPRITFALEYGDDNRANVRFGVVPEDIRARLYNESSIVVAEALVTD